MDAAIDVAVNGTRMARFGQTALAGLKITGMSVMTGVVVGTQALAVFAGVIGTFYVAQKAYNFAEKKFDERAERKAKEAAEQPEIIDHGTHGTVKMKPA